MGEVDESMKGLFAELQRGREALVDQQHLRGGGGGSTSGGVTDDWKASVDRQLGQLHGDVRALLYGLIGGFLFLIGAGGFAYAKLADQQTAAQVAQAKTDAKIDLLVVRTAPAK